MEDLTRIINIEKAIRGSDSHFVRSLPGFMVRFIRKIIREEELNATIYRNRNKTGIPFINDVLKDWKIDIVLKGAENLPQSGRFVFVANHPVGGIDALSFLSTIYKYFPDVITPSNELLNFIPNLKPIILGVNVFGINTKETVEKFNLLFESDSQIMIFPAGEVSRRTKGIICDCVWQKSFVTKSIQYKRDIIPVHIGGRNSGLFYFTSNLRKFLKISMPVEIILLPREMMKQRNSSVTFTIGKTISWESLKGEGSHNDLAQKIKAIVYCLPGNNRKSSSPFSSEG